jgi:trigger factor
MLVCVDKVGTTKNELEEAAVLAVAKDAEVDIPNGMIELELDGIEEDMNTRLSYQGVNLDQYLQMIGKTKAEYRAENKAQAEESIKIRLVLEALVKAEKIEADKKAVDERIAELAKAYGRKEDELKKNADLISRIEETIKNEAAIKLIVDNAKVKENEVVEEHHHDHGPKAAKKTAKKETKKESKKEDKAEEKPAKKETKKSSK